MSDTQRTVVTPQIPGPSAPETKPAEGANTRPAHVPEKFWKDGQVDTEGLLKSYTELEKKTSTPPKDGEGEPKPDLKIDETKPEDGQTPPEGEKPADNGLPPQFKKYDDEFRSTGKLSEDSYKELEKIVPRAYIDSYMKMAAAQAEAETATLMEVAGGSESYAKMAEWARESLSPAEKEAFNKALDGGTESAKLAISGLYQKFTSAEGREPSLLSGNPLPTPTNAFRSWDEVTVAMSDPRYKTDPAYQKDVQNRLAVSNI